MVVHVYGKTHHLPVTVNRDAHHMAGKNNRKVKNVVTRLQNPPTADAPKPHPFDTANQMMEGQEEVHFLVEEKGGIDEVAFEAFKASHPAQGEQGWWDDSQPFSRKDTPQQRGVVVGRQQGGCRRTTTGCLVVAQQGGVRSTKKICHFH